MYNVLDTFSSHTRRKRFKSLTKHAIHSDRLTSPPPSLVVHLPQKPLATMSTTTEEALRAEIARLTGNSMSLAFG